MRAVDAVNEKSWVLGIDHSVSALMIFKWERKGKRRGWAGGGERWGVCPPPPPAPFTAAGKPM